MRIAPVVASALLAVAWSGAAPARLQANESSATVDAAGPFSFAVVGTDVVDTDRDLPTALRAIDDSSARFVVHFDRSSPSSTSCADATLARRRDVFDATVKPVVPVVAASAWADCGSPAGEPLERLDRLGDLFFGSDWSLGQGRMPWLRQSASSRFHRYRENLRWQVGRVLFVTLNLPDNNNNFRIAAGRNGEFEERALANRAWIERAFRIATERRLAGIVIFVDAAPRFGVPLRAPDSRSRERDGYYEWKLLMRELVPSFRGQVLLVQGRVAPGPPSARLDQPLRDTAGRPVRNFDRIAVAATDTRWLRIAVDPDDPKVFRVDDERVFDDPSGELYGVPKGR